MKKNQFIHLHSIADPVKQYFIFGVNLFLFLFCYFSVSFANPDASQLPEGGSIVSGSVTLENQGSILTINQSSSKAVLDWQSFDIGSQAIVNFNQPDSQSTALNRIYSSQPSQIFGQLNATGNVILTNTNGIYFSPSATVDVQSLTATTHQIKIEDFLSEHYHYDRNNSSASIVNAGTLKSKLGGYIALLAPEVINEGIVIAQAGSVVMASGESIQLNFLDDHLSHINVTQSKIDALVENKQAVLAPEGMIILSAHAASEIRSGVVNNEGLVEANGISTKGGRIFLEASDTITHSGEINADASSTGQGGDILLIASLDNSNSQTIVSGSLSAKGGTLEGDGGFIETSASHLSILPEASISTNAPAGQSGLWLLDPTDVTISSGSGAIGQSTVGVSTIETALASGSVTIEATNDITVSAALSNNTANNNTLTLTADSDSDGSGDINVNAVITIGAGDGIALNYGSSGYLTMARDDATNTFTGKINLNSTSTVNINGSSYTVITSLGAEGSTTGIDLQGLATNSYATRNTVLASNYVLGTDIDASATSGWNSGSGFKPIGDTNYRFSGNMNGLGHTVNDLYISRYTPSASNGLGLFGVTVDGTFENIGFVDVDFSGDDNVGALAGLAYGIHVNNVFSTGTIEGKEQTSASSIGGIIGNIETNYATRDSLIRNTYSGIAITNLGTPDVGGIGGLVGRATGSSSYNITIEDSYATGRIQTTAVGGGLVGSMSGGSTTNKNIITRSYATGNVIGSVSYLATNGATVNTGSGTIGGLVGSLSYTDVTYSSATGNVEGRWNVGGFAGYTSVVTVTDSYARGDVDGNHGLNTTDLRAYRIGGFIGYAHNTVLSNTYSVGLVTYSGTGSNYSTYDYGAFVGYSSGSTASNSYWDTTVNNSNDTQFTTSVLGAPKTTSELYDMDTFLDAGWDISPDQTLPHNVSQESTAYPILVTENGTTTWKIYGLFLPVSYTLSDVLTGYTYDGTSQLPSAWTSTSIFGGSYNDWVLGTDYYIVSSGSDVTGFTNAGTYSSLTVNVTKSGFAETSSGSTSGSFVISPKTVTLSGEKTYDGDNTLTGSEVTIATGIGSETLTYSSATANDTDVTTENKYISAITLGDASDGSGGLASNYQLPTLNVANAPVTINAKSLTISGITASNKIYDGDTTSTIDVSSASYTGLVSGDSVSVAATGIFSDKNVGTGKTVTLVSSYSGDDSGNYSITDQSSTTANITAKSLGMTINKIYDATQSIEVEEISLTGVVSGDTTPTIQQSQIVGTTSQVNIGSFTDFTDTIVGGITLNNGSNYTLTGASIDGTVSARPVIIAIANAQKNLGESDPSSFSYTVFPSGLLGSDTLTGSVARVAGETPGTYLISDISGLTLSSSNYSIVPVYGRFTINTPLRVLPPKIKINNTVTANINTNVNPINSQTVKVQLSTNIQSNNSTNTQADNRVQSLNTNLDTQNNSPSVINNELLNINSENQNIITATTQSSSVETVNTSTDNQNIQLTIETNTPNSTETNSNQSSNQVKIEDTSNSNAGISNQNDNPNFLPQADVVTVTVPKTMTTSGNGFSFSLPTEVQPVISAASPQVELLNGSPLPEWIKFNPETLNFDVGAVPASSLPLQIVVSNSLTGILVIVTEE